MWVCRSRCECVGGCVGVSMRCVCVGVSVWICGYRYVCGWRCGGVSVGVSVRV